jgi:hypothetical protein
MPWSISLPFKGRVGVGMGMFQTRMKKPPPFQVSGFFVLSGDLN